MAPTSSSRSCPWADRAKSRAAEARDRARWDSPMASACSVRARQRRQGLRERKRAGIRGALTHGPGQPDSPVDAQVKEPAAVEDGRIQDVPGKPTSRGTRAQKLTRSGRASKRGTRSAPEAAQRLTGEWRRGRLGGALVPGADEVELSGDGHDRRDVRVHLPEGAGIWLVEHRFGRRLLRQPAAGTHARRATLRGRGTAGRDCLLRTVPSSLKSYHGDPASCL